MPDICGERRRYSSSRAVSFSDKVQQQIVFVVFNTVFINFVVRIISATRTAVLNFVLSEGAENIPMFFAAPCPGNFADVIGIG